MQTIIATLDEGAPTLSPSELAEFLFLFRAANVALAKLVPTESQEELRAPSEAEIECYRGDLAGYSPSQLDAMFDPCTEPGLLRIEKMTLDSPMEIVFIGFGLLIVLAAVFSGGQIEATPTSVKATLLPLGKGLKCLREALGLNKRLHAGYGIRETTIKLNAAECAELMKPQRGSGGFQSFFKGLQCRVNKSRRELTLSEADLDRIYRHKARPSTGGWQARFLKIFGRHFPEDRGT